MSESGAIISFSELQRWYAKDGKLPQPGIVARRLREDGIRFFEAGGLPRTSVAAVNAALGLNAAKREIEVL